MRISRQKIRYLSLVFTKLVGLLLVGHIFSVWLLATLPEAHECVHHDAHEADHACAVTLLAQGFTNVDTAISMAMVPAPSPLARPAKEGPQLGNPDCPTIPGRAPPI